MKLTRRNLRGLEHLAAVTDLLQRIRLEDRYAGIYEAADMQWWWRKADGAQDAERQRYCFDEQGQAVACLLLLDDGDEWNNDFIYLPSTKDEVIQVLPEVVTAISRVDKPSKLSVAEDDVALRHALEIAGFVLSDEQMSIAELVGEPPKPQLPTGFQLTSRVEDRRPHHMIRRNGEQVEARLNECSLYRPDLDLCVRDPSGTVAAYVLFWMDQVTSVGLIEPVRTDTEFQRMGLATHLIAEGVERLRRLGADSIRVAYSVSNVAAANLYHQAGFEDRIQCLDYRLER
jgi:ribosomal protein S18 acetylase RimI-like enzyme